MKTLSPIICTVLFFVGCSPNPNKEARIQQLETEIKQKTEKINELDSTTKQLEQRVLELEKE